jgi:hypothetical protein
MTEDHWADPPAGYQQNTALSDHPSWPASPAAYQEAWARGPAGPTGRPDGPVAGPAGGPLPMTEDHWADPPAGYQQNTGLSDHPSWPASQETSSQEWPGGAAAARTGRHSRPATSHPGPYGGPHGGPAGAHGGPAGAHGGPAGAHRGRRGSSGLPRRTPLPAVHHDPHWRPAGPRQSAQGTPGEVLRQVMLAEPGGGERWQAGRHTALPRPGPGRAELLKITDSVRLAEQVLADAGEQAAEITRHASAHADAVRAAAEEQVAQRSREAAELLAAAERQAAQLLQQAALDAAAVREAAEREAAQLREAVATMSAELGTVASYVIEHLTLPASPLTRPARSRRTAPGAPPGAPAPPAATPAVPAQAPAPPAAKPARKPAARPARRREDAPAKPAARPRQYHAMRLTVSAVVALCLFAATAGATEIALHGFPFFVFRSAGTGATAATGLQENQGPGQPDAPGAHHSKAPAAHKSHHSKGHRKTHHHKTHHR